MLSYSADRKNKKKQRKKRSEQNNRSHKDQAYTLIVTFFSDRYSCLQKEWELNTLVNSIPPLNLDQIELQLKFLAGLHEFHFLKKIAHKIAKGILKHFYSERTSGPLILLHYHATPLELIANLSSIYWQSEDVFDWFHFSLLSSSKSIFAPNRKP